MSSPMEIAYKKYQELNAQKQAQYLQTGKTESITFADIAAAPSPAPTNTNDLSAEAERKLATQTYVEAQRRAQEQALSSGQTQNVDDFIPQARQTVESKYTTSIKPGYSLLGGGSKVEVPEQRTLSVPIEDKAAKTAALEKSYALYQAQNLSAQRQYLDRQSGQSGASQRLSVSRLALGDNLLNFVKQQEAGGKVRYSGQVDVDASGNVSPLFFDIAESKKNYADFMGAQRKNKQVSVELNDTIGLNGSARQAKKEPDYPTEQFQPNLQEQVFRGTVGYLGDLAADVFDFNSKHTTGSYSLGAKKAASVIRDATSLHALAKINDALFNITGNNSYKDYAAHARHESQLEAGETRSGAFSEIIAQGRVSSGYGADENSAASLAAIQKERQQRPLEYVLATGLDIAPALLSIGGKGPSAAGAKKTGASGIVQRAFGEESPATSAKPSGSSTELPSAPSKGIVDFSKAKVVGPEVKLPSDVLKISNDDVFKITIPKPRGPAVRDSVDFWARAKIVDDDATLPSDVLKLPAADESTFKGGTGVGKPSKPSTKPDEGPTNMSNNGLMQILEKPQEQVATTKTETTTTSSTAETIKNDLMSAETVNPDATQVSASTLGFGNSIQITQARIDAALKQRPAGRQSQQQTLKQITQVTGKQRNDATAALRQLGKTPQSVKQQKQLLERQIELTQIQTVAQKSKTKPQQLVGFSASVFQTPTQRQTLTQTPKLSDIPIPKQSTRAVPTQGPRQTTTTVPRLDIPTLTRTVPDNPFIRIPNNRPPPPRVPTRTPPPPYDIKIPPPKLGGDGSFGLLGMRRPRKLASDVDALGVANPFYTPLSISVKPTRGALKRHGSGGMFSGLGKVRQDPSLGFATTGGKGKGRKMNAI